MHLGKIYERSTQVHNLFMLDKVFGKSSGCNILKGASTKYNLCRSVVDPFHVEMYIYTGLVILVVLNIAPHKYTLLPRKITLFLLPYTMALLSTSV